MLRVFFDVFSSCFSTRILKRFLTRLGPVFDPYVGPMLAAFSTFFRLQVEVLSWSGFGIDFWSILDPPGTSKIAFSSRPNANFWVFWDAILSTLLEAILDPKMVPKSSPRGFKNPSETKSKNHTTWMSILNPTWRQLGLNLGPSWPPKGCQKRQKRVSKMVPKTMHQNDPNMTPKWPQNDPQNPPKMIPKCFQNRSNKYQIMLLKSSLKQTINEQIDPKTIKSSFFIQPEANGNRSKHVWKLRCEAKPRPFLCNLYPFNPPSMTPKWFQSRPQKYRKINKRSSRKQTRRKQNAYEKGDARRCRGRFCAFSRPLSPLSLFLFALLVLASPALVVRTPQKTQETHNRKHTRNTQQTYKKLTGAQRKQPGNTQEIHRQETHRKHTGNTQEIHRKHTGNTQETYRKITGKHAGHTQETCRKHTGNIHETHRKHTGNRGSTQKKHRKRIGITQERSGNIEEAYRKHPGSRRETNRKHTKNAQETLHAGNTQENMRQRRDTQET